MNRIVFLDGLRGWASLAVLLSHLINCFLGLSTPQLQILNNDRLVFDLANNNYLDVFIVIFLRFISDGHLAVMIFFVISGYALSSTQLHLDKRNLALVSTSRYFRLMLPILVTSLIAYLLLKFDLFFNLQAATTPEKSLHWLGSFYKFSANLKDVLTFSIYDVFFKYDSATTYNSSLWTMHVELFGSFIIYAFLGIYRVTKNINWNVIVLLTVFLIFCKPLYACFFSGYIIAELNSGPFPVNSKEFKKYTQPALLCLFITAAVLSTFFREDDRLTFSIATILVFSISYSFKLTSFFSSQISKFFGKISFPLYLIQIPIICSLSSYLFVKLPLMGFSVIQSNYINLFITIIVSLLVATLLIPIELFSVYLSKKIGEVFIRKNI